MPMITTIKLTGENHVDIEDVCDRIRNICDQTGVQLRGPIPLPTRRLVVPCRKAPDGEGSETWDHWEMRIPHRLIELMTGNAKEEAAVGQVMRIPYPDTVAVQIKVRSVS